MKDKPYTERTGGSYLHDPKTDTLTQVVKPPERPSPQAPAAEKPAAPPIEETPVVADAGKAKKDK